jgi:tellurium resistance protein TerD
VSQPHRKSEDRDSLSRRRAPILSRAKKVRGDGELVAHVDRGAEEHPDDDLVLDISAFLITASNQVPYGDQRYCVFYNERLSTDQSTRYVEDDNGAGEHINVNLRRVDLEVTKIVFCVSIYDAEDLGYTFDKIPEAHFWIEGPFVGGDGEMEEVYSDNLSKHFGKASAVVVGEIHRSGDDGWKYIRLGHVYPSLREIGDIYGVTFG